MTRGQRRWTIVYAPVTHEHLRHIEAKYYTLIREIIDQQLSFAPLVETRNRKPLKRPVLFLATWELRFGPQNRFRVFYDVAPDDLLVSILAIGRKVGNRVIIGGEEIVL